MTKLTYLAALLFAGFAAAQTSVVHPQLTSPLGREFTSLPDEKGVVAAARKNLEADPSNAGLLLKLALAQAAVWQYREAVDSCAKAIALAPSNADLYTERGHREVALREFERAKNDLQNRPRSTPKRSTRIITSALRTTSSLSSRPPPPPFNMPSIWRPLPTAASTPPTGCMLRYAAPINPNAPPRLSRPSPPP